MTTHNIPNKKVMQERTQLIRQFQTIMGALEVIGDIIDPLIEEGRSRAQRNLSPNGEQFVYRERTGETSAVYEHNGTLYEIQIKPRR